MNLGTYRLGGILPCCLGIGREPARRVGEINERFCLWFSLYLGFWFSTFLRFLRLVSTVRIAGRVLGRRGSYLFRLCGFLFGRLCLNGLLGLAFLADLEFLESIGDSIFSARGRLRWSRTGSLATLSPAIVS